MLVCLVAMGLAACTKAEKTEGSASVEDRGLSGEELGAEGATAAGAGDSTGFKGSELDDPNSPLSQRIIYFDYDSNVIKPQFQSLLEQHARFLRANDRRHVVIEGHTDERGGREYNLALGQRRSEAVRRALGLLGVPDSQVEAVSFGKEKPAAPGSDEASWAKNRRAELVYR